MLSVDWHGWSFSINYEVIFVVMNFWKFIKVLQGRKKSSHTLLNAMWVRDFSTNWSAYLKHFIIVESITFCDFLSLRLLSSSQQIPSPPIKNKMCGESKWLFQHENQVIVNGAYGGLGEIECVLGLFCGHVISCSSLILSAKFAIIIGASIKFSKITKNLINFRSHWHPKALTNQF